MVRILIKKRGVALVLGVLAIVVLGVTGMGWQLLRTRHHEPAVTREIVISARNFAFNETNPEIRVRPGEHIRFVFRNDEPSEVRHNFRIVGMDRDCGQKILPGESAVIEVTMPDSGEFAYTCCAHPGMGGRLVVEEK